MNLASMDRQLDVEYLGMTIDVPLWDVLVLGAPLIKEKDGIVLTGWSQDMVQEKCQWGLVLKLGERAYEKARDAEGHAPYHPGDWVFFNPIQHQSLRANNVLAHFVPDGAIVARIPSPKEWEIFHEIKDQLVLMREDMLWKREDLAQRSKEWELGYGF